MSGRFHGARLRGGIIGDQEVVFAGLIRRVKLSSLGNVTGMSLFVAGWCGERSYQMSLLLSPKSLGTAIGDGGKRGCRREGEVCGEKDGARELEGKADCLY